MFQNKNLSPSPTTGIHILIQQSFVFVCFDWQRKAVLPHVYSSKLTSKLTHLEGKCPQSKKNSIYRKYSCVKHGELTDFSFSPCFDEVISWLYLHLESDTNAEMLNQAKWDNGVRGQKRQEKGRGAGKACFSFSR